MRRDSVFRELESGQRLGGTFWPAGVDEPVAGVIEWSRVDGARVELITRLPHGHGWPRTLGTEQITVHGEVGGRKLTLLGAWVNEMGIWDVPSGLHSATMILGTHCTDETAWLESILVTANLSEWRRDTGLRAHYHTSKRAKYPVQLRWEVPTKDPVTLPAAQLIFEGTMDSKGVSIEPDWSIETWQQVVVKPDSPLQLDELYRRYAAPLVSFTAFVSDRPDAIIREELVTESRQKVAVLRQGPEQAEPRAWRLDHQYLFPVEALGDYAGAIRRWWELFEQTWPGLGMFAEHINDGMTYSPARFLTLHVAAKAYCSACHGKSDLKRLKEYAGVPDEVTGCTKEALSLIGVSRQYFGHVEMKDAPYSLGDVQDNAVASTRRLSALMQACLMRELGISATETESLLRLHYQNWPIP